MCTEWSFHLKRNPRFISHSTQKSSTEIYRRNNATTKKCGGVRLKRKCTGLQSAYVSGPFLCAGSALPPQRNNVQDVKPARHISLILPAIWSFWWQIAFMRLNWESSSIKRTFRTIKFPPCSFFKLYLCKVLRQSKNYPMILIHLH